MYKLMEVVVIIYNKEIWYSLELSHIIKRDGIVLGLSYKINKECLYICKVIITYNIYLEQIIKIVLSAFITYNE